MLLGNLAHESVLRVQPPASVQEAIDSVYRADVAKRAVPLHSQSTT